MLKLIPISPNSGTDEQFLPAFVREVLSGTRAMYGGRYELPWVGYLAQEDAKIIGTCAFKSAPTNGKVEIAYFTFPDNQHRGVATRMAENLIEIARKTNPKLRVTAQTLPQEGASTAVLKRNGFTLTGTFSHPSDGLVWEWERGLE